MQQFIKLWSVSFIHKYYKVLFYKGFNVVPSIWAREKIRAYGFTIKQTKDALLILYKEEASRPALLQSLQHPLKLVFHVYCQDSFFLNYSAIELEHMDQCFLLSNAYPAKEGRSLLHPDEQLTQQQRVIQVSSYENLEQYIPGNDSTISVCNGLIAPDGTVVYFFKGTFAAFKEQYSFADLLEQGCFSVRVNDGAWVSFYAMAQKRKQLFAVLELTLQPGTLPVQEPVQYTATIGAKHVTWRYNIVEKGQTVFSDFTIYAGKQTLKLKPVTKTVLGNGSQAFVLESSEPIQLCEAYDINYEVEFSQSDAKAGRLASRKRIGLPIPDISRIKVSKNPEGFKAYSDMYIYV